MSLTAKWERVRELVRKELLEVFRDPRLVRMVLVAPVIQLLVFGYAVSTDVRRTPTFVVDQDNTQLSRDLADTFFSSGYFHRVGLSDRPRDLTNAIDRGRALVGLEIPRGFARDAARGTGVVQVVLDGTSSNTATIAMGYAQRIVQNWAQQHAGATLTPPVELRERAWFNPDLSSRDYNVPAVMGNVLLVLSLMLTSLAVVRERELGTLEQLMVSPLTPGELIVGKTVPFALLCIADLVVIATVALLWFQVPFRGSLALLLLAGMLYLISTLGPGAPDLDLLEHPAGGGAHQLPVHHAAHAAFGADVPDHQHAARLPVADAAEPGAPFPRDRTRGVPQRRRPRGPVALLSGAHADRRKRAAARRAPLPQDRGMSVGSRCPPRRR